MKIESPAFADGAAIPAQFTCDGRDTSPPLNWSGPPPGTRSFILLCDDPDAPGRTWHHWAAYDIPASVRSFAEGAAQRSNELGFKQAINDFGRRGYGGPCPPEHHGPHHYHFRLLALSVEHLSTGQQPSCTDIEREARKHSLGEAILVGVYKR